jgi:hypothetical protein
VAFKDDPTTPTQINVFEEVETSSRTWNWLYVDNGILAELWRHLFRWNTTHLTLRRLGEWFCAADGPSLSRRGLNVLDVLVGDVFKERRKADMRNIDDIPNIHQIDTSKTFVMSALAYPSNPGGGRGVVWSSRYHFFNPSNFYPGQATPHIVHHQIHGLHATNDRTCITEQRFPFTMQSMDDGTHHGTS